MLIAYQETDGTLAILNSCHDSGLSIEDIAAKDVPAGAPYRLISPEDIPATSEYRDAWTMDFSNPDGYGLGAEGWLKLKGLYIE